MLIDALHKAHTAFGVTSPAICLIRPDTYIGFRGPVGAADTLIAYLDRIFAAS
jgi:hypothetical protein